MSPNPILSLEILLSELFAPHELAGWLQTLPDGKRIYANLPRDSISSAQFAYNTVDILRRYDLLSQGLFWTSLQDAAPIFLKTKVTALALIFGVTVKAFPVDPAFKPQPSESTRSIITVLLLSASPSSEQRLRVDIEFREIINRFRGTRFREQFRFIQVQAARFADLQTALLEHQPNILHMSGLGYPDGSLQFEADDNGSGRISKARLLRVITTIGDDLRLVIVNACQSHEFTRHIPPKIDLAIGMSTDVPNVPAISFAVSFYEILGYNRTVENAFEAALGSLDDAEGVDEFPKLFPPADSDPNGKRKLKLIA
jgi:hypothetical protein